VVEAEAIHHIKVDILVVLVVAPDLQVGLVLET
jgi:hypothetical protein